jgi:hypothetical protein
VKKNERGLWNSSPSQGRKNVQQQPAAQETYQARMQEEYPTGPIYLPTAAKQKSTLSQVSTFQYLTNQLAGL